MSDHPAELGAWLRACARDCDAGVADLDAWVETTLATTARLLDATGYGLLMLDDQGELRCVGSSDQACQAAQTTQLLRRLGPAWDVLDSGQQLAVADLAGHPRYRELAGAETRAVLATPLRVAGQSVGVLHFYRRSASAWTVHESSGAVAVAGVLSVLLVQTVQSRHQDVNVRRLRLLLDPLGACSDE